MSFPRTPPKKETKYTGASESDACSQSGEEVQCNKVLTRRQRRQKVGSPEVLEVQGESWATTIRAEIMTMLSKWNDEQSLWKVEQEKILKKLSEDVTVVKLQNAKIQKSNAAIEKSIEYLSSKYEELQTKLDSLEAERKETVKHVETLEFKNEELQRHLKISTIEIRNVPKKMSETKQDVSSIIKKTFKALEVEVQPADIRNAYCINNKSGNNTVVTEFCTVAMKNTVIQQVKAFNKRNPANKLSTAALGLLGPSVPIYLSESLTANTRRLFNLARDFAKNNKYRHCWSANGRIFLRKSDDTAQIHVKDEKQLVEMKATH